MKTDEKGGTEDDRRATEKSSTGKRRGQEK